MNRIPVLTLCAATVLFAGRAAAQEQSEAPRPPNVLLIVADDLGWGDVGFHGSEIATPNLDRLAREGVELSRFYAFPLCSPTRFALMTGRHPVRAGWMMLPLRPWEEDGLKAAERTLAETFKSAGYQTAMIGKWHLGHARREFWPQSQGFDFFYGCLTGMIDYYAHTSSHGGLDWQLNGESQVQKRYSTNLLAEGAVEWMAGRDPKRPFFVCLSFNAPHLPYQAPSKFLDNYPDEESEKRQAYCAMVEALDHGIGKVLDGLAELGLGGDTLVIFLSDHGNSTREPGVNAPLRGGKGRVLEGGIRVPALVRWPGKLDGGRTCDQVLTVLDLHPTLAAAAGAETGGVELDGEDLLEALLTGEAVPRRDLFFGTGAQDRHDFCLMDERWKLCLFGDIQTGQEEVELYDLQADPFEQHDRAAEEREVVEAMLPRLRAWKALQPDSPPVGDDPPETWRPPPDWAAAAKP